MSKEAFSQRTQLFVLVVPGQLASRPCILILKCSRFHHLLTRIITWGQDWEVRSVMQQVNGVEGISRVQLTLATWVWSVPVLPSVHTPRCDPQRRRRCNVPPPSTHQIVRSPIFRPTRPPRLVPIPLIAARAVAIAPQR
jgi:hypothetical protein